MEKIKYNSQVANGTIKILYNLDFFSINNVHYRLKMGADDQALSK